MSDKERTAILALVSSAKKGDQNAYESLYKKTVYAFRGICARYFQHTYDIDDALQESYVRIFRGLSSLETPEAFFSWSRTIVQNTCLNMIRSRNLISSHEILPNISNEIDPDGSDDRTAADYRKEWNPEAYAESKMKALILNEILDSVSDIQRSCILLWAEGYTYKAIAQRLSIPAGTAKSTVHYTKKKISERILKIEKEQGVRLHGMAPVPYFLWLLEQNDSDETTPAHSAPSAGPEELSPADLAAFSSVMQELVPAGSGIESASAISGVSKNNTFLAFAAAGILFLALLFPIGRVLASGISSRAVPYDIALSEEAIHSFHVSGLASGSRNSYSDAEDGLGADPSSSDTLRPDSREVAANVSVSRESDAPGSFLSEHTGQLLPFHSGTGIHPEENTGDIEHRQADDPAPSDEIKDGPEPVRPAPATEELLRSDEELLPASDESFVNYDEVTIAQQTTADEPGTAYSPVSESDTAAQIPGENTTSEAPDQEPGRQNESSSSSEGSEGMSGNPERTESTPEAAQTPTPAPEVTSTPTPAPEETTTPSPTPTPEPVPQEIPIQQFQFAVPGLDFVLNANEPQQVPFYIYPENATEQIVWSSDNPYVAIDENGIALFSPPDPYYGATAVNIWASTNAGSTFLWTLLSYNSGTEPAGKCGNDAYWYLDGTTLVIYGSGDIDISETSTNVPQAPWVRYNNQITAIDIQPGITGIGASAFHYLRNVYSVVIPEGVTFVGSGAFLLSNVHQFFVPRSMECLYGLALDPTDGTGVEVIYAGSEEEWNSIYMEDPDAFYRVTASLIFSY